MDANIVIKDTHYTLQATENKRSFVYIEFGRITSTIPFVIDISKSVLSEIVGVIDLFVL